MIEGNVLENTVSDTVSLTNCADITVSGNNLVTTVAGRSAVLLSATTRATVTGGMFKNTTTPSGDSCGVYVTGASPDVAVSGIVANNFRFGDGYQRANLHSVGG